MKLELSILKTDTTKYIYAHFLNKIFWPEYVNCGLTFDIMHRLKKVYNFNCINKLQTDIIGRNIIENGKTKKKSIMKKTYGYCIQCKQSFKLKGSIHNIFSLDVLVNASIGLRFFFIVNKYPLAKLQISKQKQMFLYRGDKNQYLFNINIEPRRIEIDLSHVIMRNTKT